MTDILDILPLTQAGFDRFGDVIEADPSRMRLINNGTTERFHALAEPVAIGQPERLIFNIFRGQPRKFPHAIDMMERHPFGTQSFVPLSGRPFLVAVSDDEGGRPGRPLVFLAQAHQGVNYFANTWHHPLMVLADVSDFLVVDRDNTAENLEEYFFETAYRITEPDL
ncbi:ureidoglycolate lyase [Neorhizobium sp. JUb45]|uniref:ureidoglycolate lyase n=1 Tax=unclassified Neorhizobium TaxID=2629175 RepID=UPI00104DA108|nr:ureidoglycolate lyase [Neorhizobium sp. JUb45]TCR06692.1 ureidoglycolate lyase [Neorhizobium sp. JUb45]